MSSERCSSMYCATFFSCQPARPPRIGRLARPAPLLRRRSSCMSTTLSASTYCFCPAPGYDRLRFELERGLPQVVVEEEEPRRELAFGETQLGVDQRSSRIDVEIGDACQLARLVPGGEPVTGGNEAQCPAELLERGARQSLHQRLAVVPLGALAHDQQMARRPEAGLERLTPDDFDGVGPDSIPCRDLTARDIRGGKLYDGPESGRRNGGRFAHERGLLISRDPVGLLERVSSW